jgi:hypothetical protein
MHRQYSQFKRTWRSYTVGFSIVVVGLAFSPIIPFDEPWPASVMIALFALLLLVWIPMISWVVRKRQGVAWSVRELPDGAGTTTQIARLALWNSGFFAIRNQSGANDGLIVLCIECRDPAATIVDITAIPTPAESTRFGIRLSPGQRRAELATHEIAIRRGALFTIEHTGAHGSGLVVTGTRAGTNVTFFPPDNVVTLPTWDTVGKCFSAIPGVLILLGLAAFWIHAGRSELILPLHGVIVGLVLGTISGVITIVLQIRGSRGQAEHSIMKLVGLPVGLERFFENG